MATLNPKILIRESLFFVFYFYPFLLFFSLPVFIVFLSKLVVAKTLFFIINLLFFFTVRLIFIGGRIWFCYQRINQEKTNISQSLQKALDKFTEIFFLGLCSMFLLLLPIFFPRLYFVYPLVIVKDYSAVDAFKRSWQLTKGYGWQIFWALMTIEIIYQVVHFFTSLISASMFGFSGWELNREFSSTEPAFVVNTLLTISVDCFLYFPLLTVYQVLMFVKLLKLEQIKLDSDAI